MDNSTRKEMPVIWVNCFFWGRTADILREANIPKWWHSLVHFCCQNKHFNSLFVVGGTLCHLFFLMLLYCCLKSLNTIKLDNRNLELKILIQHFFPGLGWVSGDESHFSDKMEPSFSQIFLRSVQYHKRNIMGAQHLLCSSCLHPQRQEINSSFSPTQAATRCSNFRLLQPSSWNCSLHFLF